MHARTIYRRICGGWERIERVHRPPIGWSPPLDGLLAEPGVIEYSFVFLYCPSTVPSAEQDTAFHQQHSSGGWAEKKDAVLSGK